MQEIEYNIGLIGNRSYNKEVTIGVEVKKEGAFLYPKVVAVFEDGRQVDFSKWPELVSDAEDVAVERSSVWMEGSEDYQTL